MSLPISVNEAVLASPAGLRLRFHFILFLFLKYETTAFLALSDKCYIILRAKKMAFPESTE